MYRTGKNYLLSIMILKRQKEFDVGLQVNPRKRPLDLDDSDKILIA